MDPKCHWRQLYMLAKNVCLCVWRAWLSFPSTRVLTSNTINTHPILNRPCNAKFFLSHINFSTCSWERGNNSQTSIGVIMQGRCSSQQNEYYTEADTYPNIFSGQRRNYDLYFGLNIYASCMYPCGCVHTNFVSFVSIITRFLSTMESCMATF